MSVTVTTQAALDQALADKASVVYINSPAGVWLWVEQSGSSHIEAWDSSHIEARGSSHVVARGSSHVVARDSSHVVARGSSHIEAWDSSHVVAWDSSHVVARGSSHVVAGKWTAVHLHSPLVTLTGGVVIDMTTIDRTDPQTWCDLNGIPVTDGTLVLYKALGDDLTAGEQYGRPVTYTPGQTVTCDDWRDDHNCGGGLHLSPAPASARMYRSDATRYVAVQVALDDLRPIGDKAKVRRGVVLHEVDVRGRQLVAS